MLILLDSSIGMMETEILGYKCPLYGRRTGQLKLEPLRFMDISYFFPGKTTEELVKIFENRARILQAINDSNACIAKHSLLRLPTHRCTADIFQKNS